MADLEVTVDTKALEQVAADYAKAGKLAMVKLLNAGKVYLEEEAPKDSGRLRGDRSASGSISGTYTQTADSFKGEITISAINAARAAASATVHYPSGKTKEVKLRAQKPFDYAKAVATGKPRQVAPKQARAFLIPVQSAPTNETYLTSGGKIFITRRHLAAVKPNDYPGRALKRLSAVADAIVAKAFKDVAGAV